MVTKTKNSAMTLVLDEGSVAAGGGIFGDPKFAQRSERILG